MYFDRFDVCEAHYVFYCDWHGGGGSPEYQRLSRMGRYFKPRHDLAYDTLTENGQAIYDALEERCCSTPDNYAN